MKTKSIILSLVVVVLATVSTMATEPGNPTLVVYNQNSNIFKVIYKGEQVGSVDMMIYDRTGNVVFEQTVKNLNGFTQRVNFKGMKRGEYTLEINSANGKSTQKIAYY